jgi:hypothetical protein
MIKSLSRQRGISGTTLLFLIILGILALVVFFKLLPLYMENMTVSNALAKLQEDPKITQKMDHEIRREFLNILSEKDVESFTAEDVKQQLTIYRLSDVSKVEITLKYQRTKPLMFNVSFLVNFENSVEAP